MRIAPPAIACPLTAATIGLGNSTSRSKAALQHGEESADVIGPARHHRGEVDAGAKHVPVSGEDRGFGRAALDLCESLRERRRELHAESVPLAGRHAGRL